LKKLGFEKYLFFERLVQNASCVADIHFVQCS